MTFRLADPYATYPTPAPIDVPTSGGTERQECTLHFRLLSADRARELALESDEAYLAAAIDDWDEVSDAEGKPLECTPETIALLARIPYFVRAAINAHARFQAGLPGKTSVPSDGTGAPAAQGATR